MVDQSAERQVVGFIDRFAPEVARAAKTARAKVRRLLPEAFELVYDNYNALALAFGPSERASEVILSIALYPRWVSLFFARGARLPDPNGILRGSGKLIRHVVLQPVGILDSAPVRALIAAAVSTHPTSPSRSRGHTIIKSISAKQRPRRPPEGRTRVTNAARTGRK
jgi:hypothetical protein